MLAILSSSKTLDFDSAIPKGVKTESLLFESESKQLVRSLKTYNPLGLQELLSVSKKLAEENYARFQNYSSSEARPALFAYKGDVYRSFQLDEYGAKELRYAQKTILIVSGLYGLVRPLDGIKPYRLEMNTQNVLKTHKTLYDFWGSKLSRYIDSEQQGRGAVLINLASKEYSSAICTDQLKIPVINVEFKEKRDGKVKTIALFAKKARGAMADFMIQNQIKKPEQLKDFRWEGYRFDSKLSDEHTLFFVRN